MPRLRDDDKRRIDELEQSLLVMRLDGHFELGRILCDLRSLLGVEQTAAWGAAPESEGFRLVFSFVSGSRQPPGAAELTRTDSREDLDRVASMLRPRLPSGKQELRVLLCATPSLVAWVGAFQMEAFTARQASLLERLAPAFERRVAAERALDDAQSSEAGLLAALAAISRPAFLVDQAGCVRHTNAAGEVLLGRDRERAATELANAIKPSSTCADVTRIDVNRQRGFLVVFREDYGDASTRVARAASMWGLTRKQAQILSRLVTGEANKVIATGIGRAESTVELHVTEILRRAGVENRAALIAKFWATR